MCFQFCITIYNNIIHYDRYSKLIDEIIKFLIIFKYYFLYFLIISIYVII